MEYKISVIVPIYNVEKYLQTCIDSILNQSYVNIEVILVNDGSSDNCGCICDRIALMDKRVKVIHKKNCGLSSARNVGLDTATGDYVIFLDSDDWWVDKEFLKISVEHLNETNSDLLLFQSKRIYEESGYIENFNGIIERNRLVNQEKTNALRYLLRNNLFKAAAWDKMIKRSILITNNIIFPEGKLSEDQKWCGKLILFCRSYDTYSGDVHRYRQRSGSISKTISKIHIDDIIENIKLAMEISENIEDIEVRNLYYAYYAYEFVVLLGVCYDVANKEMKKTLRNYSFLMNYSECPKVRLTRLVYKIFGISATIMFLHSYISFKEYNRK